MRGILLMILAFVVCFCFTASASQTQKTDRDVGISINQNYKVVYVNTIVPYIEKGNSLTQASLTNDYTIANVQSSKIVDSEIQGVHRHGIGLTNKLSFVTTHNRFDDLFAEANLAFNKEYSKEIKALTYIDINGLIPKRE